MSTLSRLRNSYMAKPSRASLRLYLIAKARTGRYDRRMFAYYNVNPVETVHIKRAVVRAYARGLVPTSTNGGRHASGSLHYIKRAVDFGLIERHIGTNYGRDKMAAFQKIEYSRHLRGLVRFAELIGPTNSKTILRGRRTTLAEGTALENAHDNHVHEGF